MITKIPVLFLIVSTGFCIPLVQRSLVFDDLRLGEKLTGQITRVETDINRVGCAISCLQTPECMSFNFFVNFKCELNSGDAFTNETEMITDPASNYQGMRKEIYPECFEKGLPRDIRNDDDPNFCHINRKRQDEDCSPWEESLEEDSKEQWKRVASRKVISLSHGGMKSNCTDKLYKVLEWYYFIHSQMIFSQAVSTCRNNYEAEVFYRINGTRAQLEFFDEKLSSDYCYWLGIERPTYVNRATRPDYVDIKGNPVAYDLIVWSSRIAEPSKSSHERVLMVYHMDGSCDFAHDSGDNRLCLVVCDKI